MMDWPERYWTLSAMFYSMLFAGLGTLIAVFAN